MNTNPPRYHGFTCPQCGSHNFGSHKQFPTKEPTEFPVGTFVGYCSENAHSVNGCTYKWNRDDPTQEGVVMYEQTPEEWKAAYDEFRRKSSWIFDGETATKENRS